MSHLVAVTGGSGFIGSNVVDALVSAGHRVRVLDHQAPHRQDVEWTPVDILDHAGLVSALKGVGPVVHLAAMADVNDVFASPSAATSVNVVGTVNVLDAARLAGAGRVVLASTIWVYGATNEPVVDESTPFDPACDKHLYITTKIAAEMACRDFWHLYQRPYTILRYGIPYGPRMRDTTVMAAFFRRALAGEPLKIDGDGRQTRNFVYVGDLARAHVLALDARAENGTFNLEGLEPVSIRRIAELTAQLVPGVEVSFGEPRPGDLAAKVVRTERASEVLGWTPEVRFDEGIRRTFDWYVNVHLAELEALEARAAD